MPSFRAASIFLAALASHSSVSAREQSHRSLSIGLPDVCAGDYEQPEKVLGIITLRSAGCAIFLDDSSAVCDELGASNEMDCFNPAETCALEATPDSSGKKRVLGSSLGPNIGGKRSSSMDMSMPANGPEEDVPLVCNYNLKDHTTLALSLEPSEDDLCLNSQTFRLECTDEDPEIGVVCPVGFYPVVDFGNPNIGVSVSPRSNFIVPGTCLVGSQSTSVFSVQDGGSLGSVTVGCVKQECIDDCAPTRGTCPESGDSFGFRIKACGNDPEVFLGQNNLGDGGNRVQASYCNRGVDLDYDQDFRFEYDPSDPNQLQLRFEDDDGNTVTLMRDFMAGIDCSNGIEFLEFEVNDRSQATGIMASNIQLDGVAIDAFSGGADAGGESSQFTCFRPQASLDDGFEFTGNVAFENSGAQVNNESAKIELRVKCFETA